MKWLLVCVGIVVILAVVAYCLTRSGRVYVFNRYGYTSFSAKRNQKHRVNEDEYGVPFTIIRSKKDRKHEVNPDQFRKVIEHLLPGDRFDMLWVSWKDDEYSGIMSTVTSGEPERSISFKTRTEQAQLKSFKHAMADFGYKLEADSDGFNGGMDEEHRITSLEYTLPKSADAFIKAADTAITNLRGSAPKSYFISGSRFVHGPSSGSGIKFDPNEDPLIGIL